MKNFPLRIFYISYASEHENQLPLGCTTIHAIFLLTVRRIRMFFSLKPSLSQGESFLKIWGRWGSLRNIQTDKHFYRVILYNYRREQVEMTCMITVQLIIKNKYSHAISINVYKDLKMSLWCYKNRYWTESGKKL